MRRRPTKSALVGIKTWGKGTVGFVIYWGTTSHIYSSSKDIGHVFNYRVSGLQQGKRYYFSSKGYTSTGQRSPYSKEVAFTP